MARHTIVIALPETEAGTVQAALGEAGFEGLVVSSPGEIERLAESGTVPSLAILDGESDFDTGLEYYSLLHDAGRNVPTLMVVSPRTLEALTGTAQHATINDEYFTRPFSADALRWRVEAMLIRSATVDDGSGPIIESGGTVDTGAWGKRATVVAVFNPKGGVGKTTISINLAATLQVRRGQRVLLIDADTVTGHIANSLGMDQLQTVADAWADDRGEGAAPRTIAEIATHHPNGLQVAALTTNPLETEGLDAAAVGDALDYSRRGFDFIIIDMHPSYGMVNKVVFDRADRILVPITPDVPALRAGVQLYGLAEELGIQDKLSMVVNRANSGVSVGDMERTVGMPAMALIRSGGLLFVHAANEGKSVVEKFPKDKVTEDFDALADRLIGAPQSAVDLATAPAKPAFRLFGRTKEPSRA